MNFVPRHRLFSAIIAVIAAAAAAACTGSDREGWQEETPSSGGGDPKPEGPVLRDADLRLETIDGFEEPTQMVFVAPEDLLVAEKSGRVRRVVGGEVQEEAAVQLAANSADERGLLGLALHPQFDANRYVYVYWTWRGGGSEPEALFGEPSMDIEEVPPLGNRIDRFVWDGERLQYDRNIIRLPSRTTDLTLDRRRGNHNGGVIDFGPDGKLYAVIGDQNDRGPLQNVGDGEERSGIDSLTGAVLRLNDDGTTPADNPFWGRVDDLALENVFVYGVRNSYGFAWDPRTTWFWLATNGQASYDQIGQYSAGDNLGWVQIMGPPARFADFKALELATDRQLDAPSFPPAMLAETALAALSRLVSLGPPTYYRPPLFTWRKAVAPTALHFVGSDALGGEHDGVLLTGDVNTGTLYRFEPTADRADLVLTGGLADRVNDNGDDAIGELGGHVFGEGFLVVSDIEQAPDGAVWVSSLANGELYRISEAAQ